MYEKPGLSVQPRKPNYLVFITQLTPGNKDVSLTHLGMNKQKVFGGFMMFWL